MADIVERLKFDAARCELQFSKGVAGNISEAAAEIERLRARVDAAHDALYKLFLSGGIDQGDSRRIQGILRGDEQKVELDPEPLPNERLMELAAKLPPGTKSK